MKDANRNLAVRVVTAIVLFPVAVWLTWLGGLPFAAVVGLAAAISAAELVTMFDRRLGPTGALGVAGAALLPLAAWARGPGGPGASPEGVALALAGGTLALLVAALFRAGALEEAPRAAAVATLAWAYAGLLPASVVALRVRFGWAWVLLLFVVSWANDTLAYFAGRAFGRHKLLERISPKKTWEGFAGGAVGSVAGALAVRALLLPGLPLAACVAIGAGGAVLGPLGDLSESMLKRAAGVKDSGRLLPGHGGLLDRIDAVLFVAPWVYACAAWLAP